MRSTPINLLKVKPLPASAFPSLRLPPSASSTKASSIKAASSGSRSAAIDVAAELENKILARHELGDNVRISNHICKRDLYWKVSKPQRDVLKKLLRET